MTRQKVLSPVSLKELPKGRGESDITQGALIKDLRRVRVGRSDKNVVGLHDLFKAGNEVEE